jgi:dienelactone hydrolase
MNLRKILFLSLSALILVSCNLEKEPSKRDLLIKTIGVAQRPTNLNIDTLETDILTNGVRYKIEYTVAEEDTLFGFEEDRVRAYLFVPHHDSDKNFPAIVAIHQWGMEKREWGKMETAGLKGDTSMFYGLELFNRGYVVLCPDNRFFGERAYKLSERGKIFKSWDDDFCDTNVTKEQDWYYEFLAQYAPTMLKGLTPTALGNLDLSCAVDVLEGLPMVDKDNIGAIGHSGGGEALVPFMLVDSRIKAGISSCGFSNMEKKYYKGSDSFGDFGSALFGLLNVGTSADIVAQIAPRAIYFTKGKWEWGKHNKKAKQKSADFEKEMLDVVEYARLEYAKYNAEDMIQVNIFEENKGRHSFPKNVKKEAYEWLDNQIKTD